MALFLVALLAGALTVLAPCVLPLLPIVLGGSFGGVHRRWAPYTIVGALSVSIVIFTLLLKISTVFIDVPDIFWKWFSGGILMVMGIVTLFPGIWVMLRNVFIHGRGDSVSQKVLARGAQRRSFLGDILVGAALGPVFSACSPTFLVIIGIVLPERFTVGVVYLIAYVLGLAMVLLLIIFFGRRIMTRFVTLADPHGLFKRGIGAVFIIVGLAIVSGFDKKIEAELLQSGAYNTIGNFEMKFLERAEKHNTGL